MMTDSIKPCVKRICEPDLDVVTVSLPSFDKHYITVHPPKGASPFALFDKLAAYIHAADARIVMQDVFGPCELHGAGMSALASAHGRLDWPVSWIQGDSCTGDALTGTQVYAVSRAALTPIHTDNGVLGATFEDDSARYCLLADVRPRDPRAPRQQQAYDSFVAMEEALAKAGMTFSSVVRTWMYIDSILTWYDAFNAARTRFFEERGVFDSYVPASTGIGVRHPDGGALIADVFAVEPKNPAVSVKEVVSPLQCPATHYRSSFSRASELDLPDHRRLYVSGTASIESGGKTAHVGDVDRQIGLSMEVVEAILSSRGMGWSDISRAVAYFKHPPDARRFGVYCREHKLSHLPIAIAHSDICRDDLLFEIEADAVVAKG